MFFEKYENCEFSANQFFFMVAAYIVTKKMTNM